ncbi:MAG: helix-turn-helix transcriptional regulator [Lachnospiraceae bacterium]|nr:helix-turn-helix transcriptional regulator [Lachnospiraceae bacterium]
MFEDVKNCGVGKFISRGEWSHPDRIIDSYEIIFVTKGEVYINEDGAEYPLKEDEILILQPNLRHYGYKTSTNTEFFWLHWCGGPKLSLNMKHRKIENPYNISLYFRQLLDARVMQKTSESLDYLTRLVLIELYFNSKQPNVNPVAEKIAAWIKANCHTPVTETQIAAIFGYNADYLNRIFKASFLKTMKQYINEKRIEYIKGLMLRGDLTLKEIAEKSGFTEYKYFLKFFKYHEKITPTDFYKQYAKMHINSR